MRFLQVTRIQKIKIRKFVLKDLNPIGIYCGRYNSFHFGILHLASSQSHCLSRSKIDPLSSSFHFSHFVILIFPSSAVAFFHLWPSYSSSIFGLCLCLHAEQISVKNRLLLHYLTKHISIGRRILLHCRIDHGQLFVFLVEVIFFSRFYCNWARFVFFVSLVSSLSSSSRAKPGFSITGRYIVFVSNPSSNKRCTFG